MFSAAAALLRRCRGRHRHPDRGSPRWAIGTLILEGELGRDARLGGVGLGIVTGLGIAATINLDALRAERLFVRGGADARSWPCAYTSR